MGGVVRMPMGCGPRHVAVDDVRALAYVVCELNSQVVVVALESMFILQKVSTLPDDVDGFAVSNTCAAIKLRFDGQMLYASNRGHDTIVAMKLDDEGRIGTRSWCSIGGKTPRDFFIDPAGKFVLAFGQDSGTIARCVMEADGSLTLTEDRWSVRSPVTCARVA